MGIYFNVVLRRLTVPEKLVSASRRFPHASPTHVSGPILVRCCTTIHNSTRAFTTSTDAGIMGVIQDVAKLESISIHRAVVGLGSNMGDRIGYIEKALHQMSAQGIRVISLSKLYQTKAMYYENQDAFVNGACYIETSLSPHKLLDVLQAIENSLGRVRKIDKGPRTIDLDIILYNDVHIIDERLEIPHKLMLEREFVLRPLADIVPEYALPISFYNSKNNARPQIIQEALATITMQQTPMNAMTILSPSMPPLVADDPTRKTRLMSIMNITPDSFSDGASLSQENLEHVQHVAVEHIRAGATVLDIGGQSTRPYADLVNEDQELERILPVIEAIKNLPEAKNIALSVDTFYSKVAAKAIDYGADIINDVSGGLLDPDMLKTVAKHDKTIILMHMRGNPKTMNQLTEYHCGVVNGVGKELRERVQAARAAGIAPWRIILDPGIGFAKTQTQNLELIRGLPELRSLPDFAGLPWLVGVSRKGFVGRITGAENAQQRTWGTAAAISASIAGGADMVRVHDTNEMKQVADMADAIYRVPTLKS